MRFRPFKCACVGGSLARHRFMPLYYQHFPLEKWTINSLLIVSKSYWARESYCKLCITFRAPWWFLLYLCTCWKSPCVAHFALVLSLLRYFGVNIFVMAFTRIIKYYWQCECILVPCYRRCQQQTQSQARRSFCARKVNPNHHQWSRRSYR